MTRLVHDDRTGEDQDRILALDDVDAIRVRPAEPPLRHGCHRAAAASELVLVIEEVAVRLEIRTGERWMSLGDRVTDDDGRVRDFIAPGAKLDAGLYRLTFRTGEYFSAQGAAAFHPEVTVTFEITDAIATNWRSLGLYDTDTEQFAFTWLFAANQKKDGEHTLTIRFRKSWARDLS